MVDNSQEVNTDVITNFSYISRIAIPCTKQTDEKRPLLSCCTHEFSELSQTITKVRRVNVLNLVMNEL